jgi:hypothetical protein
VILTVGLAAPIATAWFLAPLVSVACAVSWWIEQRCGHHSHMTEVQGWFIIVEVGIMAIVALRSLLH